MSSDTRNVIELNGNLYDALSGKLVSQDGTTAKTPAPAIKSVKKTAVKPQAGKVMDGFMRPAKTAGLSATKPRKPVPNAKKSTASLAHPQHQLTHHRPEHAKTLVRAAVRKPTKASQITALAGAVATPAVAEPAPAGDVLAPMSKARVARAEKVPKSNLISRFGFMNPTVKKTALMKVKAAPEQIAATQLANEHAPLQLSQPTPRAIKDPLTAAVNKATAHEQPRLKRPSLSKRLGKKIHVSSRLINLGAATLAVLLIAGFIAVQNLPNLEMRVATARAGIHASLPGYQPAGFAIKGPIQYSPGQVTVSFHSNSDERTFSVIQRASDWNSQTLLDSFVSVNQRQYQTYEDQGKTIYIYDGSNATWVDGGTWFRVEGNSSLSSDQLLRIANSM